MATDSDQKMQSNLETTSALVIIANTVTSLAIFCVFPVAVYETVTFDSDHDIATKEDRPYRDAPYFAGNDFYNEFGVWFGVLVVIHVFTGVAACLLICFPMFITKKGSYNHKVSGAIALIMVTIMYMVGECDEVPLFGKRGYHPCAFVIDGQETNTSFTYGLYLQFTYYGPFLAETVCYGMMLIIYKTSDIPQILKYMLISLSASSIILNVGRVVVLLWIIIGKRGYNECGEYGYTEGSGMLTLIMFLSEWTSSILSFSNLRFIIKSNDNDSPDKGYDIKWKKRQHGKNVAVVFGIVTWTFLANVFYKIGFSSGTILAYVLYVITIYIYCVDAIWMRCRRIVSRKETATIDMVNIQKEGTNSMSGENGSKMKA